MLSTLNTCNVILPMQDLIEREDEKETNIFHLQLVFLNPS